MKYNYEVLIVGNGAAGYAVADRLLEKGTENICIVTEDRLLSTSRCSGSDKQTYYKLDIASPEGDSVRKMAEDLFSGGSMNGTDAYLEAANSLSCFMHLCEIGVPFPRDEYGVYQGYRTDHDNTKRATSCGPLTSKYMTEKLEERVLSHGVELLDGYQVVKLACRNGRCFGVYCLRESKVVYLSAKYTVLCTGAPSAIYTDSVYPTGHRGATGLAIEAGAALSNFQEWQYGIASKKFRWNLSGGYQQVIPRYVSIDKNGAEKEFLADIKGIFTDIFRKGYEWPFNCSKITGSSRIDISVMKEIEKGNRVFLDFTRNPVGFSFDKLESEALEYLNKAGINGSTPFERLSQLNPKAIQLYKNHGIDLSSELLEIGVCSQHNNGGIKVNVKGETTVKNLFCSGEASGRFGVCRPGGAALNDTQVGALLISRCISSDDNDNSFDYVPDSVCLPSLSEESNIAEIDNCFGRKMSDYAGAVRNSEEIRNLISEIVFLRDNFENEVKIRSESEYGEYFALYHNTLARLSLCITELESLKKIGSRGGCLCTENENIIPENKEYRNMITITEGSNVTFVPADPIPDYDCAFESLIRK